MESPIKFTPNLLQSLPSYIPPLTSGTVIKVYDGDTITVASCIPGMTDACLYKFSIRLKGIDTPEIRTKNKEEKEIGIIARNELRKLIMKQHVTLCNISKEKYGRLLCDVYLNDTHINQWLIQNKLAVAYAGGKKQSPDSWKAYYSGD